MTQLLQSVFTIGPFLFLIVLFAAAYAGIWLIFQLKKSNHYEQLSVSDRLFLKRNASRLRKIQLH
ncbi:hypothetical protein [Dyadobacter luticola]|uniref:Uncharacterized protein n=1 Tax=Dyadobacter luticola TaxID=1979387 RepID=A0A5R9L5C0_9BACT|nr:hypothetical protein [Dyadobacter luticola]TLV03638.1 hypothetical protein FEN17_08550 [Dyadobacter luticola]